MEYILVKFDDENKVARVALRAADLLPILNQREADNPTGMYRAKPINHSVSMGCNQPVSIIYKKLLQ